MCSSDLVCEMSAIVQYFEHSLSLPFFGIGMKTDLFQSCEIFVEFIPHPQLPTTGESWYLVEGVIGRQRLI